MGARVRGSSELETSLVYRATFRIARATQTNLVFKTSQTNQEIKTTSYQSVLALNSIACTVSYVKERVYNGGEGMTAKAGSWLISFNHNPVDTKNRKWVEATETPITPPMMNFIQKGSSY